MTSFPYHIYGKGNEYYLRKDSTVVLLPEQAYDLIEELEDRIADLENQLEPFKIIL